jgi:hypothetical protein
MNVLGKAWLGEPDYRRGQKEGERSKDCPGHVLMGLQVKTRWDIWPLTFNVESVY